jgi:hypothetical protein
MRLGNNKQALLLVILLTFSCLSQGQPARSFKQAFSTGFWTNNVSTSGLSIVIDYSLPEINLEEISRPEGTFYRISIPGHINSSEVGKPELPVLSRLVEIPEGYSWKVQISNVVSTTLKPSRRSIRGKLFPAQEGETKDQQQSRRPLAIDSKTYALKGYLKSDTVRIEPVGIIRHKHYASLTVSPVTYDPSSNKISIIKSMKVEITFVPGGSKSGGQLPESRLFGESVSKGVLNYDPENVLPGYSEKPVRMIILTDTAFRKAIKPFIAWKTEKGFKVEVIYKGAGMAGENFTAIKSTLATIYNSSTAENPPPEYLLIIGDGNRIPYYTAGNYTDMYYGEYDGSGDYLPDVFIGRIPAEDTTRVRVVLNKIIQYEKYTFGTNDKFTGNALITAGVDYDNQRYMNGQVYYGINNYLNATNNIVDHHFYYSGSFPRDSILKITNNGVSFINYTGHGGASGWITSGGSNLLTTNDISLFTNKDMYPFIVSNACSTSSFYSNSSFGNIMVTSSNKGAVGFIGCSDNSYWDEDYYWAVGVGAISTEPTYETTGLGALDRLFHTHGEKASDWYISMGQVNYAGNLAVSSSTSSRKKYYWETYNLVGDPSVIPYLGTPDTFRVAIPDTLPDNLKTFSIITEPFAYAGVTHADTLVAGVFASESGSIIINLPGYSNDSILIVLTGQNHKPFIKKVYFGNTGREYVNLSGSSITDATGNNNGKADFGETVGLNITVTNSGTKAGTGLYAKITSSSPWVSILNDSVMIGSLNAGSTLNLSDLLMLKIAGDVPDLKIITIDLLLKDIYGSSLNKIDICAHAPTLDITGLLVDDSITGNGNYSVDPGETVNLQFTIGNTGSSTTSGVFSVSSSTSDINVIEPAKSSGTLEAGAITNITEPIKLSENIDIGTTVTLTANLNCYPVQVKKDFTIKVGKIRESFESSTFRVFPWINKSVFPWKITSAYSYDGRIAARSGAISHNQTTSLSIRTYYEFSDSVRFSYMVSSEAGWDYLYVKVNDVIVFRKSGDIPWTKAAIYVPSGYDKVEWIYSKDGSVSAGLDCAMIDMIDFSSSGTIKYISKDISVARISSPATRRNLGSEIVVARLLNLAPDTINGFNLAYCINGKTTVSQYFNKQLVPFSDSVTVAFNTPADLTPYGIYNIEVYSFSNGDDYLQNDTARIKIVKTDIEEPFTVSPNPFFDKINVTINTDSASAVHITITNLNGVILYDNNLNIVAGRNVLELKGSDDRPFSYYLKAGIYYMRIEYSGMVKTIPIVKIY